MNEKEFAELAAGFALNALSPEDQAAFDTAREQHPEWERVVVTDAATAASLADGVSSVTAPAELRARLLARIAGMPAGAVSAAETVVAAPETMVVSPAAAIVAEPEAAASGPALVASAEPDTAGADADELLAPQEPPVADEGDAPAGEPAPNTATIQAISRRNWTRGILALAASLVLLVTLGFGAVTIGQLINRPAAVVALEQIEDAPDAQSATAKVADGGTATVHWSESLGKVVLVSDGLPSIAKDESFELWYVREAGAVSAGTFDNETDATVLLDGTLEPGDVIAVTVEQQGGSPSGVPTTDPIVTIPTA